ncbi:MAG: CoA transferase [Candidatus Tectomicrobia bacterium]|nr:CoA transferase [Candidatus Tectomicrobia bacterium]
MPGPLEGIRVLDLTRVQAGPYCSMILGDLGAEIIKIEPPEGDLTRRMPPHFYKGESSYFLAFNRNKKSVVLDLKTKDGLQIFYDLVKLSDVVLDNFRPGVMERLNLTYEMLKEINSRIISCSVTGYGETGPYRDKPSYDLMAQALSGGMSVTGEPGRPPVRMGVSMADLAGGMFAVQGILAAYISRQRTGVGQRLDISLLDGQIALMTYLASYYFISGEVPGPQGSGHLSAVPYGAFKTKDSYIVIAGAWAGLCEVLGIEELATDPRFDTITARVKNKKELEAILSEIFITQTTEEWLKLFDEEGIPASPVNRLDQALADPHVLYRKMILTLEHPLGGTINLAGNPIKMPEVNEESYTPPPLLGQQTEQVLSELLGYSKEKIDRLRNDKIIEPRDPAGASSRASLF